MMAHNKAGELGFGIVKSNVHRLGYVTVAALLAADDYGRRLHVVKTLDEDITLPMWMKSGDDGPTEEDVLQLVRDKLNELAHKNPKLPGPRKLHHDHLATLTFTQIKNAYDKLVEDEVLEKNGNSYRLTDTVDLKAAS
jgi:hypothetical protein